MDAVEELRRNIDQARNGLAEDQKNTPWGQLLIHIGPHLGVLIEKVRFVLYSRFIIFIYELPFS